MLFNCIYIASRLRFVLIQDGLTGSAWGDWANYTDSPLRAFEDELGVQAPVGFWVPQQPFLSPKSPRFIIVLTPFRLVSFG